MFKLSIDFKSKELANLAKQKPQHIRTGIRKAFYTMGKRYVTYLKDEIDDTSKKTGRVYLYKKSVRDRKSAFGFTNLVKEHTASKPGEYPAKFSGKLGKSLSFLVTGSRTLDFGSTAFYAKWLQEGTKSKSDNVKMAPRKLIKETMEANETFSQTTLSIEVKKALVLRN